MKKNKILFLGGIRPRSTQDLLLYSGITPERLGGHIGFWGLYQDQTHARQVTISVDPREKKTIFEALAYSSIWYVDNLLSHSILSIQLIQSFLYYFTQEFGDRGGNVYENMSL